MFALTTMVFCRGGLVWIFRDIIRRCSTAVLGWTFYHYHSYVPLSLKKFIIQIMKCCCFNSKPSYDKIGEATVSHSALLENVNDKNSNMNLSKRFSDLYNGQWCELSTNLECCFVKEELEKIKYITCLMQTAYERCKKIRLEQLQSKTLQESLSCPEETQQQEIMELLLTSDEIKKVNYTPDEKFSQFFRQYIDCCWLITVSKPQMVLTFDVSGCINDEKISNRFQQFATQEPIKSTKSKGTILAVVWPCVELQTNEGIYAKGSVIAVNNT